MIYILSNRTTEWENCKAACHLLSECPHCTDGEMEVAQGHVFGWWGRTCSHCWTLQALDHGPVARETCCLICLFLWPELFTFSLLPLLTFS